MKTKAQGEEFSMSDKYDEWVTELLPCQLYDRCLGGQHEIDCQGRRRTAVAAALREAAERGKWWALKETIDLRAERDELAELLKDLKIWMIAPDMSKSAFAWYRTKIQAALAKLEAK